MSAATKAWMPLTGRASDNAGGSDGDRKRQQCDHAILWNNPVSASILGSFFLNGWKPKGRAKDGHHRPSAEPVQAERFRRTRLAKHRLHFMLPREPFWVIQWWCSTGRRQQGDSSRRAEDSTGGLGGYHGSVHISGKTIYYAIGCYSRTFVKRHGQTEFPFQRCELEECGRHVLSRTSTKLAPMRTSTTPRRLEWPTGLDVGFRKRIGDYPIAGSHTVDARLQGSSAGRRQRVGSDPG